MADTISNYTSPQYWSFGEQEKERPTEAEMYKRYPYLLPNTMTVNDVNAFLRGSNNNSNNNFWASQWQNPYPTFNPSSDLFRVPINTVTPPYRDWAYGPDDPAQKPYIYNPIDNIVSKPTLMKELPANNVLAPYQGRDYVKEASDIISKVGPLTKDMIKGTSAATAKGLSAGAKGAIGAGLGLVGSIGGKLIADGYDDGGVGNTVAGVGNAAASILAATGVGAPIAAGVGALANIVGGGITRSIGVKVNKEKKAAVDSNINNMKTAGNLLASANTHAGVLGAAANSMEGFQDFGPVATNGWFNKKGDRINNSLRNAQNTALAMQGQGLATGVKNADLEQKNRTANSFIAAYGGDLTRDNGMGAIDYGFMSDLLANKRKQLEVKDRLPGMVGMPNTLLALGGDVQTHGADFTNGVTHIDAGGSHEENPNEGVQVGVDPQGTPNLVEEGETIYNDYVYSKRIYADGGALRQFHISPKRKITYADLAKRLQKEAEERPNDPISQAALKSQMADLAEHQERQKVEMQAEEAKAAFENLSPEEQVALMQQAEAQEQQAAEEEAAMQEQAMAEQQMQGQPSEEEMMQQQMMAQQGGMPSQMGQPEVISAYGGPINRFDNGGSKYDMEALIKAITKYQKGKFNLGKYKNIKDYENSDEYKAFTKEVLDYINSNPSFTTVNAIEDPRQQMLVRYLNELSGRGNDRLFGRAEDGSYKFLPSAAETYQRLREDGRAGIYHLNPALIAEAAANASTTPTVASTANTPTTAAAAVAPVASATTITDAQRDNIRNSILKSLGISTVGDLQKWAKDNKVSDFDDYDKIDWGNIRSNKSFMDALAKSNSDLAHVINTGGYDFGIYQPTATDNGIQSINRGNWNTSGSKKSGLVPGLIKGWEGSTDAMWQEVKDKIKPDMSLEDVEKLMKNTEAYKKTTEWLKSSPDNMLAYLQAIEDSGDAAPESARRHYMFDEKGNPRNWVEKGEDGKLRWKEGYTPKYEDIFGVVRNTYPGSYWHTHSAAMRNPVTVNYVQKEDGSWDKVIGDVGNDWEKVNSYSWYGKDDNNDYTYNYYKNPNVKAADATKKEEEKKWQDDYDVLPIHRNDKLRYAGLFGPAVGLGLMAAGVGRPDASGLDAAVNAYSNRGSYLPSVRYTDGYYAYRPENPFIGDIAADNASAGTARAITNTTAPYGAQQASLLANAYNDQLARGTRIAQGRQYNNQERLQALNAYKNTDQFNAQAFNANEGVRAQILNQDRQTLANMRMSAAQQKMAADAGWYNSLYGNVSGLFKGISDLGRENAQHNMIADMAANGIFGTLTPNSPIATDFLKWQKKSGVTAEGGKINRKKNKRRGGLTY